MRIVGAGLAGLLAAHAWPNVPLIEANSALRQEHKALLRFRSDSVAKLTGIEFKKVLVRKGLWFNGTFREPSIVLANCYSRKVTGGELLGDRSIWHLDPVTRWVAPENFHARLVEYAGARIQLGEHDDFKGGPLISTAPMPLAMEALDLPVLEFKRAAIDVIRYRVPRCELYQTVYYPEPGFPLYRASITGDVLIIERASNFEFDRSTQDEEVTAIDSAFNISLLDCDFIDRTNQEFGKIVALPDEVRKSILFRLTHDHLVYSLGRFATWRNILLDDVVEDIAVIKRLMSTHDTKFDLARARAR